MCSDSIIDFKGTVTISLEEYKRIKDIEDRYNDLISSNSTNLSMVKFDISYYNILRSHHYLTVIRPSEDIKEVLDEFQFRIDFNDKLLYKLELTIQKYKEYYDKTIFQVLRYFGIVRKINL